MDRDDPLAHLLVREKEAVRKALEEVIRDDSNRGIVLDTLKYGNPSRRDVRWLSWQVFANIAMHGANHRELRVNPEDIAKAVRFRLLEVVKKGGLD